MFHNNSQLYPYASKRTATYAKNGMVATSQPLAAEAGLEILKKGGNAVDAAIATAACLTVLEPTSNGIGGDAFALVWMKDELHGLNASGPSPMSLSIDALHELGIKEIPKFGFIPVTVPGVPSAWAALSKRFGTLPLDVVLAPAIKYATEGFPVSPITAYYWQNAYKRYQTLLTGDEFKHWFETFAPNGRQIEAGEIFKSPDHAKTLRLIAETNGDAFYKGELADQIDSFSRKHGGYIRKSDLEMYQPVWVNPIGIDYKGYKVWEIPPNGQGLVTLQALNIIKGFDFNERDHVDTLHKQIEAIKLAFADGLTYITDELHMKQSVNDLLSEHYANERRKLITEEAGLPTAGVPPKGGTVYLATADQFGNMVSYIQSNYMGFGSGLVVPGTGIGLQNRGYDFSMDKTHANALAPGKRTLHTIIPGFITKDNQAVGPFGVMGGFMQPQGHMQVVMNCIDFGLNPQAALDAPRWQWIKDKEVTVEHSMPNHLIGQLAAMGHHMKVEYNSGSFGRGQIIWRNQETGVLVGGCESRTDGAIAAW